MKAKTLISFFLNIICAIFSFYWLIKTESGLVYVLLSVAFTANLCSLMINSFTLHTQHVIDQNVNHEKYIAINIGPSIVSIPPNVPIYTAWMRFHVSRETFGFKPSLPWGEDYEYCLKRANKGNAAAKQMLQEFYLWRLTK